MPLPITDVIPSLKRSLAASTRVVLSAPPGAGKTTCVPPALLEESWLGSNRIIMLEPRRLAARRAAEFIAHTLGSRVGELVGYRIRGDSRVSRATRIEVVTEGILSRMLLTEQDLPSAGLVIFDEFHERSIHADFGLAFTLDLQKHLRPDLRVLVMSATLDVETVSALMGNAPVVSSAGISHPVGTTHATLLSDAPVEKRMAETILRAAGEHDGDVLAFLPGIREIRRTEEELERRKAGEELSIHQLYGDASPDRQKAALEPDPSGRRKVILSTAVAETSVTIDGVRIVVDSGLSRTLRYDARRGMSSLVTVPVSKAIADQRRGRAGRQAPGWCYRLWRAEDHNGLPDAPTPEIKETDLTQAALQLASWGDPFAENLALLDPPPRTGLDIARSLLRGLDALDDRGVLTPHGRTLASFPLHPRFAHMIVRATEHGFGSVACDLAAIMEERDVPLRRNETDVDVSHRWHAFRQELKPGGRRTMDTGLARRTSEQADRLRTLVGIEADEGRDEDIGKALGLAFPDRIGRRRDDDGRYLLSGGQTARLPNHCSMGRFEFLSVGFLEGAGSEGRILLAAPLTDKDVGFLATDRATEDESITWDERLEQVEAKRRRRLGAVILEERPVEPSDERVALAMLDGVRQMGVASLPWTKETKAFVARCEWVRRGGLGEGDWPDLSFEALEESLHEWLLPFLGGMTRRAQLDRLKLNEILASMLTYEQRKRLDASAPGSIGVPSGSRIMLDYTSADAPRLEVKLQEMFGLADTPRVGGGRFPVTVHLLSPARRPLAVTQDLSSFWRTIYPEIRAQMRAQYPRHPWPEDPWSAEPTKKTLKKKSG